MFKFTKMQSLGNDFVVLDGIADTIDLTPSDAKLIADRNIGIGCDQILKITPADKSGVFGLQIFNNDGSQSAQCGNGARCVARFVSDLNYATHSSVDFRTDSGILQCKVLDRKNVCVALGIPNFIPEAIPFQADEELLQYPLEVKSELFNISALSIGNPHAVFVVPDVTQARVEELGPEVEFHKNFPQRTNVEFMEVVDRSTIRLRVHERGVGETKACGSGASASVVAGIRLGLLHHSVVVNFSTGTVQVEWPGEGEQVTLTGPTTYVFDGQWCNDSH